MAEPLTTSPTPLRDKKIVTPPFWLVSIFLVLVVVSWVPLVVIARARVSKTPHPRIHIIQDMDKQPRYEAQDWSPIFADHRAMRPRIAGTVRRGGLAEDDHLYRGFRIEGFDQENNRYNVTFFADFPQQVTFNRQFLERGRNRFEIYCLPCHGADGSGNGPNNQRAEELQQAGVGGTSWVRAANLHDPAIRGRAAGHLFNTISKGIRSMAGYEQQIPDPYDRWAVVAYVRALQLSQNAQGGAAAASEAADDQLAAGPAVTAGKE